MTKFTLASDLDGTLIPETQAHRDSLDELKSLLKKAQGELVFATGRHWESIDDAITEFDLPKPRFIIADVGTSLYQYQDDGYVQDDDYVEHLSQLIKGRQIEVTSADLGIQHLRVQEDYKQGPFKSSFYFDASDLERMRKVADQFLVDPTNSRLDAIISVDPFNNDGLLDFVPKGVSKAYAVRWWVQQHSRHDRPVIFAGDSGNDEAALLDPRCRPIVVGNASDTLKKTIRDARGQESFIADQTNTCGVLQGVQHHVERLHRSQA